jgi:serpin B
MIIMDDKFTGLLAFAAITLILIITTGCTGTTPEYPVSPAIQPVTTAAGSMADARTIADANNRFAFDLYSQLKSEPKYAGRNIFFSPLSLSSVFAITYEGARGSTADEIRSVLHYPSDNTTLREGFGDLNAALNNGNAAYTLRTANALWAQQDYPFLPEYTGTAERYYGAKTTNLDFISQPEESRIIINRWVEDKTEEKIKDLLPANSIDSATRLIITNAIYFNGKWEKPFAESDTQIRSFYLDEAFNTSVSVRMMQRKDIYSYSATSAFQMVELPYKAGDGSDLSMLVILPKKYGMDALAEVEKSLDFEKISELEQNLADTKIALFLPKFRIETEYELPDTLKSMGMPTAFVSGAADLSGMDGTHSLFISDVIHQAFIDVSEEGTEAAASSAVKVSQGGPPPEPFFVADHPFLFIIRDKETGVILFIGRIVNPADESR